MLSINILNCSLVLAGGPRREDLGLRGSFSDNLPLVKAPDSLRQDCFHAQSSPVCQNRRHWAAVDKALWHDLYWPSKVHSRSTGARNDKTTHPRVPIQSLWIRRLGCVQSPPVRWIIPLAELLHPGSLAFLYRRSCGCRAKPFLELLYGILEVNVQVDGLVHSVRGPPQFRPVPHKGVPSACLASFLKTRNRQSSLRSNLQRVPREWFPLLPINGWRRSWRISKSARHLPR